MSERTPHHRPFRRRLLVALDAAEDTQRLLEAAADMAQRMNAELAGLFVEDSDLIGLGDNPLVRTVSAYTGVSGTLRRDAIEQMLRRQVAMARAAFERATSARRLNASFEVRRGRLGPTIESIVETTDIVVVRRSARRTQQSSAPRESPSSTATRRLIETAQGSVFILDVRANRAERAFVRIAALYDGSPEAEAALLAAAEIVDRRGGDGIVVLPVAASKAEAETVARKALDILARDGHGAAVASYVEPDISKLCALCAAQNAGVLVVPAGRDFLAGEAMSRLLDEIDCSVMVVR